MAWLPPSTIGLICIILRRLKPCPSSKGTHWGALASHLSYALTVSIAHATAKDYSISSSLHTQPAPIHPYVVPNPIFASFSHWQIWLFAVQCLLINFPMHMDHHLVAVVVVFLVAEVVVYGHFCARGDRHVPVECQACSKLASIGWIRTLVLWCLLFLSTP